MAEATLYSCWISAAAEFNCIMVVQHYLLVQLWHGCCTGLQGGVCSCPALLRSTGSAFSIHISPGFLGTDYPENSIFIFFNEIGKKKEQKCTTFYFFFPFSFSCSFHCVLPGLVLISTLLQFHFLTYTTDEHSKLHPVLEASHRNTDFSHYLLVVYSNEIKIY